MKKHQKEEAFVNPIDKDKITENPSSLPYAHTAGGAVIKPNKEAVIRSQSMAAMKEQTDMQLDQIREQMELLARQANELRERKKLSEVIYSAKIGFKPDINHVYHLYQGTDEQYVLSLIGPEEWGRKPKYPTFVCSVRLMADHTWNIER